MAALVPAGAHAGQASADFSVSLPVNAPNCSVTTSVADIRLPDAGSPMKKARAYLEAAGFSAASSLNSGYFHSAGFDQTATIKCTTPATPISSVVVQPASSASTRSAGVAKLLDSAGNAASGGKLLMGFEQVSINDQPLPWSYFRQPSTFLIEGLFYGGAINPYKPANALLTEAKPGGVVRVVWRPVLKTEDDAVALGEPKGHSFSSSGQIVVDY
ncbi:hypothetical protein QMO14_13870 [Variovorax sp. CAN2819]|uniref:hypothetical protein n=1 Tax=Variovorax sp. CAN15 TaxID=3046727 RepID=UPI0026495170|nr:hypothetical protein [Variovorax sp. CAN15]MDN6884686.1 hypothetical protein [Variovorax sp. CAN15]